MPATSHSTDLWIIGYGNPQRRDDGSGFRVAGRLSRYFGQDRGVSVRAMQQLDPVLVEDLKEAEEVLFVDATVQPTPEGRGWLRISPEGDGLPRETHHLGPERLLGLLQKIYGRCPKGWLVSVQGEDFGFGEGLSREGVRRTRQVTREIASFVSRKLIDKGDRPIKSYTKRERGSAR
jgi:hydrogenase maturation protease